MQTSNDSFENHFRHFQRRICWLLAEKVVCLGLAVAAIVALTLLLIDMLSTWYVTPLGLLLVGGLGIAGAGVYLLRHRPSRQQLALTIEGRANFHDSLRTAIALKNTLGQGEEMFRAPVLAAAADALTSVTPRGLFPHRFARYHALALCGWLLVMFLYFLPGISWLHGPTQRLERAQQRQAGERLVSLAHALENRPEVKRSPPAREAIRKMQQLGREMQQNRLSKLESLKRLNQLADEMAKDMPGTSSSDGQDADGTHNGAPNAGKTADGQGTPASAVQGDMAAANAAIADAQQMMNSSDGQQMAGNGTPGGKDGNGSQQGNGNPGSGKSGNGNGKAGTQTGNGNGNGSSGSQAGSGNSGGNSGGNKAGSGNGKGNGNSGANGSGNSHGAGGHGADQGSRSSNPRGNERSNAGGGEGGTGGGNVGSGSMGNSTDLPNAGYDRQHSPSMLSAGATIYLPREMRGGSGTQGAPSAVPYSSVYTDYRKRAERALDDEQVPPEERARVKAYFDALNPAK